MEYCSVKKKKKNPTTQAHTLALNIGEAGGRRLGQEGRAGLFIGEKVPKGTATPKILEKAGLRARCRRKPAPGRKPTQTLVSKMQGLSSQWGKRDTVTPN